MSAALPIRQLTVRPIRMPEYRNDQLRTFQLWYADNLPELERFYNELKPYYEEGVEPLCDFFSWSVIQHEREEMKRVLPHGDSL